jgi:hypothetical protein
MLMVQVNIPEEMEGSIKLYKGTGMSILSHSDSVLDLNDIVLMLIHLHVDIFKDKIPCLINFIHFIHQL